MSIETESEQIASSTQLCRLGSGYLRLWLSAIIVDVITFSADICLRQNLSVNHMWALK